MVKLHIGCGAKKIDNFINIDCRYLPSVDAIENVAILKNYLNNSVDVMYASHVLEHFSRWQYKHVLKTWFDKLKPNGVLRLAVPDFAKICEHYQKNQDLNVLIGLLYGGQDYSENFHYITFDFNSLKNELLRIGFKSVNRWDWRTTEHSNIDDYSQSYLPHMDKQNGMHMSLNVEAIK